MPIHENLKIDKKLKPALKFSDVTKSPTLPPRHLFKCLHFNFFFWYNSSARFPLICKFGSFLPERVDLLLILDVDSKNYEYLHTKFKKKFGCSTEYEVTPEIHVN